MKKCTKCKIYKSRNEFNKDKNRKDGLYCYCKVCKSINMKKYREENKEKFSASVKKSQAKKRKPYMEYKKTLKCKECGENHIACLEFHHRNPKEKDFGIGHSFAGKSMEQLRKEIAKCDVLCANCHKKLHYLANYFSIMRTCRKCKCLKNLCEFVKRTDRRGYYLWCRQCQATHGREPGYPNLRVRGGGLADGGMQNLLETEL